MAGKKRKRNYAEHLIIPDSHACVDESNDRFDWIAEMALVNQPDVIIDIGDSADMRSLGLYDVGKISGEGYRYRDDLDVYHDAARRIIDPITRYNNTHTKWKKKTYKPRIIKCRGNHEHRIVRAANETPAMYGTLKLEDLREEEIGFETFDFLKPCIVDNICYQHYFTSGIMGRPIGGVNHARNLVAKGMMSCAAGHSHMRDFFEDKDAAGRKIFGLVVGCYFEHDPHYTTEADRFWRGLVYLRDVHEGQANPEFVSIERVKQLYG